MLLTLMLLAAPAWAASPSPIYQAQTFFDADLKATSGLDNPTSVTVTAEGDLALGSSSAPHQLLVLSGSDFSVKDSSFTGTGDLFVATHPSGNLVVADQGDNSISLYPTSDISSTPLGSTSAAMSLVNTACPGTMRHVISQQTGGNSAIVYVQCSSPRVCKFEALLSAPTGSCKDGGFSGDVAGIALSPDDSYLLAFEHSTSKLFKLDATTLAEFWTVVVNPLITGSLVSSTFATNQFAVRSDDTVVLPNFSNDKLSILDVSGGTGVPPTSSTEIDVQAGCGPEQTFTSEDGMGDVVVLCDLTNSYLVLDNSLDVANGVAIDLGEAMTPGSDDSDLVHVGDGFTILMSDEGDAIAVYATADPTPGSAGDPILVDFAGHRFMGGARGRTEYLLYRSKDETEAITMTTGSDQGIEDGFFAVAVGVQRAGCGSLRIAAAPEHTAEISGDACMTTRVARGDEGMVLVPIGHGDDGSVLAVYPHQHGSTPAFLNLRLLATTPAFQAGCTGMLCNEAHGDVEA